MTPRQLATWVTGWGGFTILLLVIGLGSVAGVAAFVQLCCLVGAPLGMILRPVLRSWSVAAVVSVAVSLALTAIAVQFLVWFRIATPASIVLLATAYGVVLAFLLTSPDVEQRASAVAGRHR